MSRRRQRTFRALLERLEDRSLLSSLTPAQVRHAYGVDAIVFSAGGQTVKGTGAGQTIAVIVADHNPYLSAEVHAFDAANGLPDPVLTQVNLAGGQIDDGWAQEEALDVEWAHAIAPGASFLVVEAASDQVSDLMSAVNVARQSPGVAVVSMSWGGAEFRGQANYDAIFTTPAGHNGVTFVTASGDSGGKYGAEWPASSPNVVAVGGTSLRVDAAGNVLSEVAWSDSGGGVSRVVSRPAYQAFVQRTGRRTTPDVAMVADPNTGVAVYTIAPSTGQGFWQVLGGTSLSAQLFGGLVAIADQGRALRGAGTLDGPSQTLPGLYSLPSSAYRDVTQGWTGFRASPGYDLATGRGTPTAALVTDLANGSIPANFGARPARTNPHRRPVKSVVRRRDLSASEHRAKEVRVPLVVPSRSFGAPWALASPRMTSSLSENPRAGHSSRRR